MLVRDPRKLGSIGSTSRSRSGTCGSVLAPPCDARRRYRHAPRRDDPRSARGDDRGAERPRHRPAAAVGGAGRRRALRLLLGNGRDRISADAILPLEGARRARRRASRRCETTVFAPSIVYRPGDPWITLLQRLSILPGDAGLRVGRGALPADLGARRGPLRRLVARTGRPAGRGRRYELAGPEVALLRRHRRGGAGGERAGRVPWCMCRYPWSGRDCGRSSCSAAPPRSPPGRRRS